MRDFEKYHALGNDYLIVDPRNTELPATADAVRMLCDRHFGIGSDGVLFGPISEVLPGVPVGLQIFNADGSACEKSGNGLRIFALYLAEHCTQNDQFVVRTLAGDTQVRIVDPTRGLVSVNMGQPMFDAVTDSSAGLKSTLVVDGGEFRVVRVHNGNPHVVVPLNGISAQLAHELGPRIAGHPQFPDRVNVQLMHVVDPGAIEIEVWERGAGYTLASGSSSCAAASAAHALGLVADTVSVRMPGGTNDIGIGADGTVTMTGTAEKVMAGSFSPSLRHRLGLAMQ